MADITKITDAVFNDAKAQADAIVAKADENADKIIAEAKIECEKIASEGERHAQEEAKGLMRRLYAARMSRRRDKLLYAKQEILDELSAQALTLAQELDGELYANAVGKLFRSRLYKGECVVYLPKKCENDAALLSELKSAAAEKNCVYTVSYDRSDVKSGFVAAYGGIEENCTFEALFNDRIGELSDMASEKLFSAEAEDSV